MKGAALLLMIAAYSGMARGASPVFGIIDTDRVPAPATTPAPTKPAAASTISSDLGEALPGASVTFTFTAGAGFHPAAGGPHDTSGASSVPEWMLRAAGLLSPEKPNGAGVASAQ